MNGHPDKHSPASRIALLGAAVICFSALSACENGFAKPESSVVTEEIAVTVIETEVEDPAAFRISDKGFWDGRPTFGGVWVAYPDVDQPERVVIHNTENGREVNGAVYKRDPGFVGPAIEMSSDAAAALGMLAGVPANLQIIALRKKQVEVVPPAPEVSNPPAPLLRGEKAAPVITETPIVPEVAAKPVVFSGRYVQVATSSKDVHAEDLLAKLKKAGLPAEIRQRVSGDKIFLQVLVGPVQTDEQLEDWFVIIRDMGYTDAIVLGK